MCLLAAREEIGVRVGLGVVPCAWSQLEKRSHSDCLTCNERWLGVGVGLGLGLGVGLGVRGRGREVLHSDCLACHERWKRMGRGWKGWRVRVESEGGE